MLSTTLSSGELLGSLTFSALFLLQTTTLSDSYHHNLSTGYYRFDSGRGKLLLLTLILIFFGQTQPIA